MRQTKSETKENQRDKNGKMSLLFNKAGKGCVLDKSRKAVIEVVKKSYKGSFITEGYFLFSFFYLFFFFLITSKRFMKSSVVKYTLCYSSP